MQIFDVGGQDHFAKMRPIFADGAKGIFLAFDVTRRDSFYNLEDWYESVKDGLDPRAPKILIATKSDLNTEAEVWKEDIEALKDILRIDAYFDTSSLTGEGVSEAFETMALLLLNRYRPEEYSKSAQKQLFFEGFYRIA